MQDPKSIGGKFPVPVEAADLVVIGCGTAGLAAAIEAAEAGAHVVLIDENPVAGALIGLDVPLLYGGRLAGAGGNKDRLVERIVAASPALEKAFDLGIDVRLGTYVWGAFVNGPALAALPSPLVGIADEERASFLGFDKLIIATGARDLVLNFDGSDLPGVIGSVAFHAMLARYDSFNGRRLVILGTGELAASSARLAQERGLEVAALVEVGGEAETRLPPGLPLLAGHVILRAEGDASGVTAAVFAPVAGGPEVHMECDTIVLAFGRVPNVELLDVLGAALTSVPGRGGFVPTLLPPATSLPNVFVAGDAGGLCPVAYSETAATQGRAAAHAALGLPYTSQTMPAAPDTFDYAGTWLRALCAAGGGDVMACRCEEVSRADLLGVQPPRYLGARSASMQAQDLARLAAEGPLNPDQIKRLTRAGMGPCQGRRCREQVALLLAEAADMAPGTIPLASYRAPVRPLPLAVLAAAEETPAMRAAWEVWFGIASQWVPYDDIGTAREAEAEGYGLIGEPPL